MGHRKPIAFSEHVVTYADMMQTYAEVAGLKRRRLIPVPVLSPETVNPSVSRARSAGTTVFPAVAIGFLWPSLPNDLAFSGEAVRDGQ